MLGAAPAMLASCELYDLVIDMNWDAVAKHAQEYPQDASFEDGEWKETPLFAACQNDPSEQAIRALLKAYPPASRIGSKNGDIPIHIACRWRANVNVIRALIEHDPLTACATTKYGKTPLGALWEGYAKTNGEQETYQSACEKSIVLLEAIARTQGFISLETGKPLCLHAAMMMTSSDTRLHFVLERRDQIPSDALLYFVLDRFRDQIPQRDKKGRLPLHIAVDEGIPSRRKLFRCVFEELVNFYPEAAKTPDPISGRLPLHTMAANPYYSWNEMQVIFQAHPTAMTTLDPVTGLLPFALRTSDVNSTFCLLTAQPDVLSMCEPSKCPEKRIGFRRGWLVISAIGFGLTSVVLGHLVSSRRCLTSS